MYPLTIGLVIETKELWDEVHATLQELPVRLLVEQHELGDLAEFLDKQNRERQEVEKQIFAAAEEKIAKEFDSSGDAAIVVSARGWHAATEADQDLARLEAGFG